VPSYPTTINKPLYAKSENAKKLILSKYGNPSMVENQVEQEKWIYDYISPYKSNRTLFFDKNGKIIKNKKHYKAFHMLTGLNKYSYITLGIVLALSLIIGPFPALL
jgi:hypothetical protein|tara:strand:+ start:241 stop:558 length:318 start_codon:yes stop_codon:yes gene_type:complete